MHDWLPDHCGIFVGHSLHDTYKGMKALQHRGQDTAGIATKNRRGIDIVRWEGLVERFSLESMHNLLDGDTFIGHVRYATTGDDDTDSLLRGAHPRFTGGRITDYTDTPYRHKIVRGATDAIVHNGTIPKMRLNGDEIDTDAMLRAYRKHGLEWVMKNLPAAYACAIMDMTDEIAVFRDRHGIRPLWIGEKDGKVVAASEDLAIWDIGGKPIREVKPGEAVFIRHDGKDFRSSQMAKPSDMIKPCFFEWNYNSALSSSLGGKSINDVCYRLGAEVAHEYAPPADFVTCIPNRPLSMARGYADARGLPFVEIFYKVSRIRAFIGPNEELRRKSIGDNLFLKDSARDYIKGRKAIVIDDSAVRLNNAPNASKKAKEGGLAWCALVLCTPPLGPVVDGNPCGCYYGVDMPPEDNFAIRRYPCHAELVAASGFDDIHYLSKEGMARAHRTPLGHLCTYCIGGPNPLGSDELAGLEALEI